jgi:hypothetical protein
MSWRVKSKTKLPMYSSNFLKNGVLLSALDIFNESLIDPLPDDRRRVSMTPLRSPFQNNKFKAFLCSQTFTIACDIHGLSHMLDSIKRQPSKTNHLQIQYVEDAYAFIQHSIASFPHPNEKSFVKSTRYYRQYCWIVGAMIYLNTAIRKWDPASSIIKAQVTDLILALRTVDLVSMKAAFPEVLLWLLFIGTTAAWDKLDRGWLLLEMRHVIDLLSLVSPQELEQSLQSLLCTEGLLQEHLKPIWLEVHTLSEF